MTRGQGRVRRRVAALMTGALMLGGLAAVGVAGVAQAAPTYPEFIQVDQNPSQLVFDSATEHLTLVQEMDDPEEWNLVSAVAMICMPSGAVQCDRPSQFAARTDWLRWTGERQLGQQRFLTFEGNIPNPVRHFSYYFELTYRPSPTSGLQTVSNYYVYTYEGVNYYSFNDVYAYGDTRLTISGPERIPTGSALNLTGTMECYGRVGYKAPDYGWVDVEFRANENEDWTYMGGSSTYNQATGAWTYRNLAVGMTGDWRAVGSGDQCVNGNSRALHVEAGTGEPPEPPAGPVLPGIPGLEVADVTSTTAVLDWAPPTENAAGITGYRFGWESESGLPVPSWSKVYSVRAEDPFVMTNLNPDSDYTMWVEAVTARGTGDRATVQVHTDAAIRPPTDTTVGKPGRVWGVKGVAGNHKARISWHPPRRDGGTAVNRYQVKRFNAGSKFTTRQSVLFRGLRNGKTYRFYVRAHNAAGWGPWSRIVQVRPHR
jgi:hypothetical protein